MKTQRLLLLLAALLFALPAFAAPNAAPAIASIDFQGVQTTADLATLATQSPWIQSIRQFHGSFESKRGTWVAAADLPFGQGSMVLTLRRDAIAADLALTLVYDESTNSDFIVQLWDAQDRILAADLFSNIIVAGREAKTDTFILDLARYPAATQVVLRRLKGEICIYGLVLSPVACEVPTEECDAFEMAVQLDHSMMTPESPLVQATAQLAPPQGQPVDWSDRTVQQPLDVTAQNPYAREAFLAEDYPVFVPSPRKIKGDFQLRFTASSLFAVIDMVRLLNAYHPEAIGQVVTSLSSEDSLRSFLAGETRICMTSIPMTVAERERFFRARGYPVMEFPAAIDPILVIVHPDNPIHELTLPQLDAIFGTELRSGAEKPITTWGGLGLGGEWANRPIVLWGGSPQTGTSRLFRHMAMQDGPLSPRLQNDPYNMYIGVLIHVAEDPAAIGFLNAQHGTEGAKALALSPQTGLPAFGPTPKDIYAGRYPLTRSLYLYVDAPSPDQINPIDRELLNILYSKSGQELFARSKQAPLPAAQVREIRERLGL